jgi:hypothetical protein
LKIAVILIHQTVAERKYLSSTIDDHRYQNIDSQVEEYYKEDIIDDKNQEAYECYYCDKFTSTTNQKVYEKHVVRSLK